MVHGWYLHLKFVPLAKIGNWAATVSLLQDTYFEVNNESSSENAQTLKQITNHMNKSGTNVYVSALFAI